MNQAAERGITLNISHEVQAPVSQIPDQRIASAFFEQQYPAGTDLTQYHISNIIPTSRPWSWHFIRTFIADNEDYVYPSHAEGVHSPQHEGNVLYNFLVIADAEGFTEREVLVGAAAAYAHDTGRGNDDEDVGHGSRSAIQFLTKLRAKLEKRGAILTDEEAGAVMEICTWHEYPYHAVESTIKTGKYKRVYDAFISADMLDRGRDQDHIYDENENPVPTRKHWTKKRYLKNKTAERLLDSGFSLYLSLSSAKERLEEGLTITEILKRKALELGIGYEEEIVKQEEELIFVA